MVDRIIFSFTDSCNMGCKYCYSMFKKHEVNKELCFKIVKRCADIGIKMITFGGGDPLKYSFIYELVVYTHSLGIKCSLDTNGIAYDKDKFVDIIDKLNMISLPMDGYDNISHDSIRGYDGHFDKIVSVLEDLNGKIKLRINTVLSKKNILYVEKIIDVINNYDVSLWSIYEFIPLERGSRFRMDYMLDNVDVVNIDRLKANAREGIIIDYSRKDDRLGNHLFVSDVGELYLTDTNELDTYLTLGSIFSVQEIECCMRRLRLNMLNVLRKNKQKNHIDLLSI